MGVIDRAMAAKSGSSHTESTRGLKVLVSTLVIVILTALVLTRCSEQSVTVGYRITVDADVGDGLRSGSGVMQIRAREKWQSIATSGIGFEISGEAIPVDLGDGRHLYFSMSGGDTVRIEGWNQHASHSMTHWKFLMVAFREHSGYDILSTFQRWKDQRPVEVPFLILPKLFLSTDPEDPSSFRYLKPDELEAVGVRLRRVRVAITDARVTRGRISNHLPWLDGFSRRGSMYRFDFIR